jgi:hypothetical protein
MPTWKRKAFMEEGKLVTLKKLVRFGNSYAFVLPREFIRYRCRPDAEGNHWVEVKYDYAKAVFTISGYKGGDND